MCSNCNNEHHDEDCCCECCEEEKELVRDRRELTDEEIESIIVEKYNDKNNKAKIFIRKALRIHGLKYDYSQVDYKDCKTKVVIVCNKPGHGPFEQTPDSHINNKAGCLKCFGEATSERCRMTKEEFIKRSTEKYNGKYNYSKVEYVDYYTPVEIICPTHGSFFQRPISHLVKSDYGCPECLKEAMHDKFAKTTEQFIKDARKVHKDKYGYDKVNYINNETKVTIWCPKHGYFEQLPANHLWGFECPECGNDKIREKLMKTTEQFVQEAESIHNHRYKYDKVVYTGVFNKVTIWCPEHGYFEQSPHDHLRGKGCPRCSSSVGELLTEKFLVSNNLEYKIHKYTILDEESYVYPDFILSGELNVWIEYNGEQHYQYTEIYHKDEDGNSRTFPEQIKRDIKVRKFCKDNNIKLIEIPYTIKTYEDISDFLNRVLLQNIDPNTLINYLELYKLDDTGFKLEDLFP